MFYELIRMFMVQSLSLKSGERQNLSNFISVQIQFFSFRSSLDWLLLKDPFFRYIFPVHHIIDQSQIQIIILFRSESAQLSYIYERL